MSRFTDAMAGSLGAMGAVYGESFTVANVAYPALDIGEAQNEEKLAPGGKFKPGTLKITVRQGVMDESGLGLHKRLWARGAEFRIEAIADEGDGAPVLTCGPVGVNAKLGRK